AVVLRCNNYEVIDLGVMVPSDQILKVARKENVDIIGLSGLITPSLNEMVHVAEEMKREGFSVPLLIGGATTSRKHTAVKIAPVYSDATVHVKDASRAAHVVGALLNDELKADFVDQNRAEQEQALVDFEGGTPRRALIDYTDAAANRPVLDWAGVPTPSFTGVRSHNVNISDLVHYIDWGPFFHTWELRGSYPKIFNDPQKGEEARRLYDEAQTMLDRVMAEKWLQAEAVYGFFPANSDGDDIVVYRNEDRKEERVRLHMLRQQQEKRTGGPYFSLADFVAPVGSDVADYVGGFALTAGLGADERAKAFKEKLDDYNAIMVQALADRLAEAFAEYLHAQARRDWGYGQDENLTNEELIREKYRGIRPAPGYPACPDHTEKRTLFDLLGAEKETGIRLTESFAMFPAASVSGWYFSHPEAQYFAVGKVGEDQVVDYAKRKGMTLAEMERWLAPNLGYK
ncbi:MAG: vitamin B12 dependent-methionine synthase activation domain-containing protein, partial [Candidatus Latescibacterota bacterium]